MKIKTYFPIIIRLSDNGEEMICQTPQDVPHGRAFKVITITPTYE